MNCIKILDINIKLLLLQPEFKIARSSKGRTADFGSVNVGSTPARATKKTKPL